MLAFSYDTMLNLIGHCRLGCGHMVCGPCLKGQTDPLVSCPVCRASLNNIIMPRNSSLKELLEELPKVLKAEEAGGSGG